jgi:hypothetical protein
VFTGPPRFVGGPQLSDKSAHFETHISFPPCPPARSDAKYSESPSGEIVGVLSFDELLTTEPRLMAGPSFKSALAPLQLSTTNAAKSTTDAERISEPSGILIFSSFNLPSHWHTRPAIGLIA